MKLSVGKLAMLTAFSFLACSTAFPTAKEENALSYEVEDDIPLLSRLGLWNGTGFDEMSAGALPKLDRQNLYILVSGWAPGQRKAIEEDPSLRAWSPSLRVGGRAFGYLFYDLAPVIRKDDPDAVVFAFSWVDDAATNNFLEAFQSEARAAGNGHRLAAAINEIVPENFSGDLVLMGHSHGAKVATVAAGLTRIEPRMLVLFDSPETELTWFEGASNNLLPYLRELKPDKEADSILVLNFISDFGERYAVHDGTEGVVDVKLNPVQYHVTDIRHRHGYPVEWYSTEPPSSRTAASHASKRPQCPHGILRCLDRAEYYRQEWLDQDGTPNAAKEHDLVEQDTQGGGSGSWNYSAASIDDLSALRGNVDVESDSTGNLISCRLRTLADDGANEKKRVSLWHGEFETDTDHTALQMRYRFAHEDATDEFVVWVDDRARFVVSEARAGLRPHIAVIDLDRLPAGPHQLTLALHAGGNEPGDVIIDDFQFVSVRTRSH